MSFNILGKVRDIFYFFLAPLPLINEYWNAAAVIGLKLW